MNASTKIVTVASLFVVFIIITMVIMYNQSSDSAPMMPQSPVPETVPSAANPTSPQQTVIGNNGDVSGDRYCGGIGGKPWNDELPYEWNGATCVSTNLPGVDCSTAPGRTSGFEIVCSPTGTGWK